ncbi:hypothetical protein HBI66_154460 [Parastagonospora nodorum]|nr:hypothetical protein HBI66_154460 [Parastagonospora nodorum]
MFGTLVTSSPRRRILKFIKQTDPVAAVSRRSHDKMRAACLFCRSRKARCAGGGKRCQRCVGMNIECVYPDSRRQQQKNKDRRIVRTLRQPSAHESAMTGSESSSSIVARSATALFPLSSSMDQSLEAQLLGGYTLTEGPIDSGPLDMQLLDTNMTWATHSGSFMDTTCDPLALTSPVNEPELGDSSCHCLLHSITFLECLASDSVSRENRMDTLLAEFREAMEKLYVFLACKCCATSLEQNMLLAKAIRQISLICAKIANSFKALYLHHKKDKKNNTNSSFQQESGLDSSPAAFCSVNILVSSYRVNSREMLFLLDSLVTLHVSEFQEHIDKLKERSRNHLHQDLARALKEAEAYLEQAKETMRICMALG